MSFVEPQRNMRVLSKNSPGFLQHCRYPAEDKEEGDGEDGCDSLLAGEVMVLGVFVCQEPQSEVTGED